jgi:hypothetical protein
MMVRNNTIHVYGETDGTNGTGTFSLESDIFHTVSPLAITELRIPPGVRVPIRNVRLSGPSGDVYVKYTNDVTSTSVVWRTVGRFTLKDTGTFELGAKKTIELRGITGREAICFTWNQASPAKMSLEFDYEYVCE